MSDCHSDDGRILAPWVMKDVEQLWNTYFSKPFNWRSFALGKAGSSKKAAYRLSMTLRKNARWIDCSADTDIDQLYEQWRSHMLGASAYLTKHVTEEAAAALDRPLEITMTFWRFLEPSLKHLHDMTHLAMGNDPDGALAADEQRRKGKAEILKDFKEEVMSFIREAAYLSGSDKMSNQKLEQALTIARQAMDQAREDLRLSER
jgi:hypothetical protein